jgi:hypothetical protein
VWVGGWMGGWVYGCVGVWVWVWVWVYTVTHTHTHTHTHTQCYVTTPPYRLPHIREDRQGVVWSVLYMCEGRGLGGLGGFRTWYWCVFVLVCPLVDAL